MPMPWSMLIGYNHEQAEDAIALLQPPRARSDPRYVTAVSSVTSCFKLIFHKMQIRNASHVQAA